MTIAERLAGFAARASYDDLSEEAREQLRIRVLDSLASRVHQYPVSGMRRARVGA
jgi:2-methylcitrate dehydratase